MRVLLGGVSCRGRPWVEVAKFVEISRSVRLAWRNLLPSADLTCGGQLHRTSKIRLDYYSRCPKATSLWTSTMQIMGTANCKCNIDALRIFLKVKIATSLSI
jgi:hypothetical protein